MPCEHYKDALIDAVAAGSEPQGELRVHLVECPFCREAFGEEQSLFAAMDAGLHVTANADVPPSLLVRVRAGLDETTVARPGWSSGWFALAGAAVATAALFFAITLYHNNSGPVPPESASNQPVVSPIPPVQPVLRPGVAVARHSAPPIEVASSLSAAEILVPRDQEVLLASYARQWNAHKHAPLVAQDADETSVALLEVKPIQITELDVKPLAEGNSQ